MNINNKNIVTIACWPVVLFLLSFSGIAAELKVQNEGSSTISSPLTGIDTTYSFFQIILSPRPNPISPIRTILTTSAGEMVEADTTCGYPWGCIVFVPVKNIYVHVQATWDASSLIAGTPYYWNILYHGGSGTMISNAYYCGVWLPDAATVPDLRPGGETDFTVTAQTSDKTTGTPHLTITSGDMDGGHIVVAGGNPDSTVTIRPSTGDMDVQNDRWTYLMTGKTIPLTATAGSRMSPGVWSTNMTITMECQ